MISSGLTIERLNKKMGVLAFVGTDMFQMLNLRKCVNVKSEFPGFSFHELSTQISLCSVIW